MAADKLDRFKRVEVKSRRALRTWLTQNHERPEPVWLVTYKKHCGRRYVGWAAVVQEALCFGWIDSRTRRVDEDRVSVLLSPRKPGSPWSAVNKKHVAELEEAGLMTEAGRARIEAAQADGSWSVYDDIEALVEPPDLQAALDAKPKARKGWDAFTGSSKKPILWWIKSAKTDKTRQKRIAETARLAAKGLRAAHPESRGQ